MSHWFGFLKNEFSNSLIGEKLCQTIREWYLNEVFFFGNEDVFVFRAHPLNYTAKKLLTVVYISQSSYTTPAAN